MKFYAYILKSEKDNRYYYGSTNDLSDRLRRHNAGEVNATKNRRPLILHYFEEFESRRDAFAREMFFKKIEGYRWLKENEII
jgi:putative endonuclease